MKALGMRVRGGGILGPGPCQPWVVFINAVLYEQTEFDTRPPHRPGSSFSMPVSDAKAFDSIPIPRSAVLSHLQADNAISGA